MRRSWPLLVFVGVGVAPLVWAMLYAAEYSLGLTGLLAPGFTTDYWSATLGDAEVWQSLGFTALVAALVVGVAVVLALALALTLRARLDRGVAALVAHVPLAFPPAVVALAVVCLFTSLVHDRWALGVIGAQLVVAVPFLTLAFRAHHTIAQVDALEEVAGSLGARPSQRILRVAVPVLLRGCAQTVALLFVATFGAYEIPQLLGRQTPQMVAVLIMRKFARFDLTERPQALAIALLYAIAVGACLMLVLREKRVGR